MPDLTEEAVSSAESASVSLEKEAPQCVAREADGVTREADCVADGEDCVIQRGDCVELLAGLPNDSVDLAFADPPYNIGFKYDEYRDNHSDEDYLAWCESWIEQLHRVVKPTGSFWLAIGDEYAAELKVAAKRIGFTARNWVVWYYTFGQNCRRKFNRSHAHLFHFVKDEERHTFNAADPEIRVPSARALVYGDRRANPKGRLPDDTWLIAPTHSEAAGEGGAPEQEPQATLEGGVAQSESRAAESFVLRPQDLRDNDDAFHPQDDTWYFSRVAGTFKERQGFHGCQMPEQLLGRIVRASSNRGDLVLDPFAGSGTTLAVAKKLGRRWLGFELSGDYVKYATERIASVSDGDDLHGPADPVRSAPTTAAGRRLKGHPMADKAAGKVPEKAKVDESPARSVSESLTPVGESRDSGEAAVRVAPALDGPSRALDPRPAGEAKKVPTLQELTRDALVEAFHKASGGVSLDWLLCRPDLQAAFHAACHEAGLLGDAYQWNRRLLKLRKSGVLKKEAGQGAAAKPSAPPVADPEGYSFASEVAWVKARTKRPGASLDDLLCDPERLALFDKAARKVAPGYEPHEYRWAALRLRKAAKKLKADAVQYEFVTAKHLKRLPSDKLKRLSGRATKQLDGRGGVYLIATGAKPETTVYTGETDDLGLRLSLHLAKPLMPGAVFFAAVTDEEIAGPEYRSALRWNLTHRMKPALSLDLLADHTTL